jgi:small-conductance mechanosensitive channel
MKRSDPIVLLAVVLVLLPFFLFPGVLETYRQLNSAHPYTASFIKFAILATFGESIGLRIRTGVYAQKGFGFLPRALVWGFLGICIKMAFVIFGEGSPYMLKTMGVEFPVANPGDILRQPGFTWIKLAAAFSVGTMLNLFFAPVFMTFHKLTDIHILKTGGTLRGFFTPIPFGKYFSEIDWKSMWGFVFKKTIPIFWIPAQTLNFMLPEEWRILFAAFLSIVLGVLLSVASLKGSRK